MDANDRAIRQIIDGIDYLILVRERELETLRNARAVFEAQQQLPAPTLESVLKVKGPVAVPLPGLDYDRDPTAAKYGLPPTGLTDFDVDMESDLPDKESGDLYLERHSRRLAAYLYHQGPRRMEEVVTDQVLNRATAYKVTGYRKEYFFLSARGRGVSRWDLTEAGKTWIEKYLVKKGQDHELEGSGAGDR